MEEKESQTDIELYACSIINILLSDMLAYKVILTDFSYYVKE